MSSEVEGGNSREIGLDVARRGPARGFLGSDWPTNSGFALGGGVERERNLGGLGFGGLAVARVEANARQPARVVGFVSSFAIIAVTAAQRDACNLANLAL
jgi:hypothetical protein